MVPGTVFPTPAPSFDSSSFVVVSSAGSVNSIGLSSAVISLPPSGQATSPYSSAQSIGFTTVSSQDGPESNTLPASLGPSSSAPSFAASSLAASSQVASSVAAPPASSQQTSFNVAPSTGFVPQPIVTSSNGQQVTRISSIPVASVTEGPIVSGTAVDVDTTDQCE